MRSRRQWIAAWLCLSCGGSGAPADETTGSTGADAQATGSSTEPSSTAPPTGTTEIEDETMGQTTAAGECGAGGICLDEAPLGWVGPLVVATAASADALPSCTAPYDTPEATHFEGFTDAAPAECSCTCGVTPGLCDTLIQGWADDECLLLEKGVDIGAQGCVEYDRPSGGITIYSDFSICLPDEEETVPEIQWEAFSTSCAAPLSGATCDAGRCYDAPPAGFEAQVCYAAEGDVECPEDTVFQSRTLRYAAVVDDRACSDCECGTLPACLLTYDYYDTKDCSGSPIGTANTAQCEPVAGVAAIEFDFDGVDCPVAIESVPEGTAEPQAPWTYCCVDAD